MGRCGSASSLVNRPRELQYILYVRPCVYIYDVSLTVLYRQKLGPGGAAVVAREGAGVLGGDRSQEHRAAGR